MWFLLNVHKKHQFLMIFFSLPKASLWKFLKPLYFLAKMGVKNFLGELFDDFILSTILGKSQFVCKPLWTLEKSRVLFFGTNRTNSTIYFLSILRTISILKKPWFFNGFSTFWQNNSVIFIPLLCRIIEFPKFHIYIFHYIPFKEKRIFSSKVPFNPVKSMVLAIFYLSTKISFSILFISIHNKKNGSNALKPSKINACRDLT